MTSLPRAASAYLCHQLSDVPHFPFVTMNTSAILHLIVCLPETLSVWRAALLPNVSPTPRTGLSILQTSNKC